MSTHEQDLSLEVDALKQAGCKEIYRDKISWAKGEPTRIPLAIVSPISGPISHADTVKTASNYGSTQFMDTGLWIEKIVDLDGRGLPHNAH